MSKRKMCPRWVDKDCRHFASGPHEGKCTMIHKTNNKCELVPRKAKLKEVRRITTKALIAELEKRRPVCSAETCEHMGSGLWCGPCIWGVFIGEPNGTVKDNFKEAKWLKGRKG